MDQDPWLRQFLALALQISEMRHRYVDGLQVVFTNSLKRLAPDLDVTVAYDWGGLGATE